MYRRLILLLLVLFAWVPTAVGSGHPASCDDGPFAVPGLSSATNIIGEWGTLKNWPVRATHMTLLHTGKVIWWHGQPPTPYLWDPELDTNTVLLINSPDLFCSGHTVMSDGRVLMFGGTEILHPDPGFLGMKDSYILDPVTETWERVADMNTTRWYPSATVLPDGRILAYGGVLKFISVFFPNPIPEIYDPVLNTWTELTGINQDFKQNYPFNFLLPSGLVYKVGPEDQTFFINVDAETITNSVVSSGGEEETGVVMYLPGKILKTGGETIAVKRAEIIDMNASTPVFSSVSDMVWIRRRHNHVILPDGKVLIVGGSIEKEDRGECAVHSAEMWDPATGVFTEMASQTDPRMYHSTALLMPDGRVLSAGGEWQFVAGGAKTAELYSPPYLFKGTRPVISIVPSVVSYDKAFRVETPDATSIASVSFIRPGSSTHNFNFDQRYIPLDFKQYCTYLAVYPPKTSNIAPPGYYMLFLVDDNGVPSIAEFVRLSDSGGSTVIDTGFDVCSY